MNAHGTRHMYIYMYKLTKIYRLHNHDFLLLSIISDITNIVLTYNNNVKMRNNNKQQLCENEKKQIKNNCQNEK